MATNDFPRILTLLRKERGISQKQVSADLEISQALLSHYEKGIRECGLNFVIKAADYYGVSCDYLLGRSPHRSGAVLSIKDSGSTRKDNYETAVKTTEYNRRVTVNTLNMVFRILERIDNEALTKEISSYLSAALYCAFRMLHMANGKNPKNMFEVSPNMFETLLGIHMMLSLSMCRRLLAGETINGDKGVRKDALPILTNETLSRNYPNLAPSLFDLIKGIERDVREIKID